MDNFALGGAASLMLMRIQLHNLFDEIISVENLLAAWSQFLKGKQSKVDVQVFRRCLMDNLAALNEDLSTRQYRHGGYKAFVIADPKPRQIHKACVRDRVLHHAIYRILYPIFDSTFIYDSFSCRIDKGTHRAIRRFDLLARQATNNHRRTCWVLQCDIRKFFASVDHAILIVILEQYISDEGLMWLLREVIGSFSSGLPGKGLPLGNLTSQLLVNIYMNEFDQYVKHYIKAKQYIRYADDFVFLSPDKLWLTQLIPQVERFLGEVLQFSLHPDKVFISTVASGVDFLGWVHFLDHRVFRTRTTRRMRRRVREHPEEPTLNSYLGLISHGQAYALEQDVLSDYWLFRNADERL